MITNKLNLILTKCNDANMWGEILDENLPKYGIETVEQIAMFIAQTGHESSEYNILKENLNYSVDGLRKVFGKYFPNIDFASQYARNPEKIANRVYASRMGNGLENSGDGWLYRGRGIIQITGKNNYRNCSMYLFDDERLVENPSLLLEPENAVKSACWYWLTRNIHNMKDLKEITRTINGSYIGISDRAFLYDKALRVLNG